jgi:hypothetical protein
MDYLYYKGTIKIILSTPKKSPPLRSPITVHQAYCINSDPRATVLCINSDDDEASTRSTHSEQRSKPDVAEKKKRKHCNLVSPKKQKRKPSRVLPRSSCPAHRPQVLSLSVLPLTGHSLRAATISAPSALARLLLLPRREESLSYPHRWHRTSSEHCLCPRRAESRP